MAFTLLSPSPLIETVTVLPNPNFGDTESTAAELNILRTVDGSRRTYVKTRGSGGSTNSRRLRWDFRLTRTKALELLEFYRSYSSVKVAIEDHNGRTWVGNFVNNPLEVQMARRGNPGSQAWPLGETCVCSIEFEGVESAPVRAPATFLQSVSSDITGISQEVFLNPDFPTSIPAVYLVHDWDANSLVLSDGVVVNTWTDSAGTNDLVATVGQTFDPVINRAPTYRAASRIFNGRPSVAFETVSGTSSTGTAAMQTTSNTSIFPFKRGAIFWVMAHTVNSSWASYLPSIDPATSANFSDETREALFQAAFADSSFTTETEFGVWALQNSTLDSLVEQVHMAGTSSAFKPVDARFQPADAANDIRLATDNLSGGVPSLTPFVYCLARDSNTNLRFRTNGVERTGATISDNPGYNGKLHINNQIAVPQFDETIRGEWGQVIVLNNELNTSLIEDIEEYLALKWGVVLGSTPF
jgi:hypothetical protein